MSDVKEFEITPKQFMEHFQRDVRPTGIYAQDQANYDNYQKGWDAAIEFVNKLAMANS